MSNQEIRELLEKQLQLLSKQSEDICVQNVGRLPEYTKSMLAIAEFLKDI